MAILVLGYYGARLSPPRVRCIILGDTRRRGFFWVTLHGLRSLVGERGFDRKRPITQIGAGVCWPLFFLFFSVHISNTIFLPGNTFWKSPTRPLKRALRPTSPLRYVYPHSFLQARTGDFPIYGVAIFPNIHKVF